jgi:hypothetical protein
MAPALQRLSPGAIETLSARRTGDTAIERAE